MSTAAEPPPATTTTTTTTSAAPGNNVSPVTYVIIPLVTLASVFLVGLFAYIRRRRSPRHALDSNGDGGEAQVQERRRGADTGGAADRWPQASLSFNWWFLRSNEGLNELGEAPPPYLVERRNKVPSERSEHEDVIEEEEEEEEEDEENGGSRCSGESLRQLARIGGENVTSQQRRNERRSSEEQTQASTQEEQAQQYTHHAVDESRGNIEQVLRTETSASLPFTTPAAPSDPSSSPSSSSTPGHDRRQPPSEMVSILESHRLRSQHRRSPRATTTTSTFSASPSTSPTNDMCSSSSSQRFRSRSSSPERCRRHHIERLNRRLRRLGYVTSETTEYHGLQLRDMEDGAAPPRYERVPDVAVPPPAQLPRPPPADLPPPYPAAAVAAPRWQHPPPILLLSTPPPPPSRRRDDERERSGGPPMVRQTSSSSSPPPHHEHFLGHHYLFMPPLEPDYIGAGFSASLDMPRQLHSRF
ncbi:hypothetical protein NHJ13734_003203 [Beauveria thailandica]